MPDTVRIKATEVMAPPPWALLERRLISLMERAAEQFMEKYVSPGGKLDSLVKTRFEEVPAL